jgi:hypothetical protein
MTCESIPTHCQAPHTITYPVYLGDFGGPVAFAEARRVDWWARCRAQPTIQASDRRDLSARVAIARDKPTTAEVVAELEALYAEAQADAPPPDADLTDRALWLAALVAEEARDALAYHRGLLACTGTTPA